MRAESPCLALVYTSAHMAAKRSSGGGRSSSSAPCVLLPLPAPCDGTNSLAAGASSADAGRGKRVGPPDSTAWQQQVEGATNKQQLVRRTAGRQATTSAGSNKVGRTEVATGMGIDMIPRQGWMHQMTFAVSLINWQHACAPGKKTATSVQV